MADCNCNHFSLTDGSSVTFDQGINVGIGITNPGYRLTVSDGTKQTIVHFDSNGAYIGTLTDDNFGLLTNGGVKLFITAAGYVGIGKTNPAQPLDVQGTISATGVLLGGDQLLSGALKDSTGTRTNVDAGGCYYAD